MPDNLHLELVGPSPDIQVSLLGIVHLLPLCLPLILPILGVCRCLLARQATALVRIHEERSVLQYRPYDLGQRL